MGPEVTLSFTTANVDDILVGRSGAGFRGCVHLQNVPNSRINTLPRLPSDETVLKPRRAECPHCRIHADFVQAQMLEPQAAAALREFTRP